VNISFTFTAKPLHNECIYV